MRQWADCKVSIIQQHNECREREKEKERKEWRDRESERLEGEKWERIERKRCRFGGQAPLLCFKTNKNKKNQ